MTIITMRPTASGVCANECCKTSCQARHFRASSVLFSPFHQTLKFNAREAHSMNMATNNVNSARRNFHLYLPTPSKHEFINYYDDH